MIGYAFYEDDEKQTVVVQLQDNGDFVGEISVAYEFAFLLDSVLGVQYVAALIELREFVKECIMNVEEIDDADD